LYGIIGAGVDPSAQTDETYARIDVGRFTGITDVVGALGDSPTGRAHAAAMRASCWFAGLDGGRLPDATSLSEWIGRADPLAVSRCIALGQRGALLGFDADAIVALGRLARTVEPRDADPRLRLAVAWERLAGGNPSVVDELEEAFEHARREQLAAVAIDCQCALVMALAAAGDLSEAMRAARRASRMARTEGFPQQEYLAHLLLARLRRLNGVPHLATHILNALFEIAPPPYQPCSLTSSFFFGAVLQ